MDAYAFGLALVVFFQSRHFHLHGLDLRMIHSLASSALAFRLTDIGMYLAAYGLSSEAECRLRTTRNRSQ